MFTACPGFVRMGTTARVAYNLTVFIHNLHQCQGGGVAYFCTFLLRELLVYFPYSAFSFCPEYLQNLKFAGCWFNFHLFYELYRITILRIVSYLRYDFTFFNISTLRPGLSSSWKLPESCLMVADTII